MMTATVPTRRPLREPLAYGSLFAADVMMPDQFRPSQYETSPERGLMIAVLLTAVEDLRKYRRIRSVRAQQIVADAADWIASDDTTWPMSFRHICRVLGLSASAIRAQLAGEPVGAVLELAERSGTGRGYGPADPRCADAGDLCRAIRTAKGWSQAQLTYAIRKVVPLSSSQVGQWEAGTSYPSSERYAVLRALYGQTVGAGAAS